MTTATNGTGLYQRLVQSFALPVAGRFYNPYFPDYHATWERSQFWPRPDLDDYRWSRLRALLEHAIATVPFYRDYCREAGLDISSFRSFEDLRLLPALSKADYQAHGLERFLSESSARDGARRDSTSGTTGTPFHFFVDRRIEAAKVARLLRENRWVGWEPGVRYLRLWGPHAESFGKRFFYDRLLRRVEFDAFEVESRFDELVALFRRLRPAVVEAYASAAVQLARRCRERGCELPPPRAIVVSAEGLSPQHRALVETVLGAPVYNRYGSREVGNVAHECARGGFHVNAECFFLEEEEHPDIPGARNLLVTCFDNWAMPFLRYRIGDLGVFSSAECPCGRTLPLLERVEGRSADFFRLPSGELLSFLYFNHFFEQLGGVVDLYQVEQVEPAGLVVRVVPGPLFGSLGAAEIERRLDAHWRGRARFEVLVADEIAREPTGKLRVYKPLVRTDTDARVASRRVDGTGGQPDSRARRASRSA